MVQATNNGYTRCPECSEVYSNSLKSCPKCGKLNSNYSVNEGSSLEGELLTENLGLVFNIID